MALVKAGSKEKWMMGTSKVKSNSELGIKDNEYVRESLESYGGSGYYHRHPVAIQQITKKFTKNIY